MPHVTRDATGKISRASARSFIGAELLPHSHPEVVEFLKSRGRDPKVIEDTLAELRRTDNEMARAIEDLIMVLFKKNVLKMSDLPKPVQDRMGARVKLRMTIEEVYDQASNTKI